MTPVRPKYESIEDIFDEIEHEQRSEPIPRSANATVRPLATPEASREGPPDARPTTADSTPSGKLDDSDIIDIVAEESRMSPQPKVSERSVVPHAKEREFLTHLRATREVVGFTLESPAGALVHDGVCDDRFQERVGYFAHLGALVGKEFGLEPLREMHLVGESRRVATFIARDGSRTTVVTGPSYETQTLSRWIGK